MRTIILLILFAQAINAQTTVVKSEDEYSGISMHHSKFFTIDKIVPYYGFNASLEDGKILLYIMTMTTAPNYDNKPDSIKLLFKNNKSLSLPIESMNSNQLGSNTTHVIKANLPDDEIEFFATNDLIGYTIDGVTDIQNIYLFCRNKKIKERLHGNLKQLDRDILYLENLKNKN